ncbi:type I polyketide synthase [Nocardia jejuensis]|uniref:type I polyketide synthase n=1 Tax=Nocardia jejuensis TaxID=328049 RepID=UPI00083638EC|nr:type I polyketide synthase [Nocardia jejuensis]
MSADKDMPHTGIALTDVAIIAMQCRLPGADNVEQYWSLLAEKREGTRVLDQLAHAPGLVRSQACIDGVDLFDAAFFGYLPADAAIIDPQQRLFLECAYHLFEQAGYDPDRYQGLVGVYAGSGQSNYHIANVLPALGADPTSSDALPAAFANAPSSLTGRVSYHLNLRGPSLAVNTACSTALVAIHLACQDLLDYRCDLALAGAVSITPNPGNGYRYVPDGPLSPDGRCRAFDADAAGMFPGDGLGIILLKRLSEALADGDRIRAVIKGSAVNNDGRNKVGFVAPSITGQSEVILAAHAAARIEASSIGMVEAHGTATLVGDPIEVAALTKAFRQSTDRIGYCLLGSAKTNIGHTDTAAGVAGLIKAVLSLEHGLIPANLHYTTPNPLLDLTGSPFRIAHDTTTWPESEGPRRAGVSAFGIGGTNAHIVLEQAPPAAIAPHSRTTTSRSEALLILSAATPTALDQQARRLADHLRSHEDTTPTQIADVLQLGRRELPYRRSLLCRSATDAAASLDALITTTRAGDGSVPLILLLPGGGAQYAGMGRELYDTENVFRSTIDRCAQILAHQCGIDLIRHLYRDEGLDDERLEIVFPALLATEYALAALLASWGLEPSALLGHSLGEYTAACLAGVLELDQALPLVSARGRLFARGSGATTSIACPAAQITPLLTGRLTISALTTASTCTVSGPTDEIAELERQLQQLSMQCQRVRVPMAAHSPELDPVLEEFADLLTDITLSPPRVPYLSNVTGTWIQPHEATNPAYWVRHSREPVQLAAGFDEIARMPHAVLMEVGPGRTLTRLARLHHDVPRPTVATMRHHDDERTDRHTLLSAVGLAWEHGVHVDWHTLSGNRRHPTRIELPGYPFERQRHWITPPDTTHHTHDRSNTTIPVWRTATYPALPARPATARWLVLTADDVPAREAATQLAELLGPGCDVAEAGQERSGAHYQHIVFLADGPGAEPTRERYTELARVLDATDAEAAVHMCVRNAFDITGTEALDVPQWLAIGAAQWLRRHTAARTVDVVDTDRIDAYLLAAELSLPGANRTVAYRNGRRWLLDSEPITATAPAWSTAAAQLRTAPIDITLPPHSAPAFGALDELCTRYVYAHLHNAGVSLTPGTRFTREELLDRLDVAPQYHKIIDVFLRILRQDGLLTDQDDHLRVLEVPASADMPHLAQWCTRHPDLAAQAQLLDQCMRGYAAVLRGQRTGNEILMPGGDDTLYRIVTEQRSARSNFRAHCTSISTALLTLARNATTTRPLRILEIGAGRGYLTWPIAHALRDLPAETIEYHVTDIGRSFVVAAQQRAESENLEFLRFTTLDITADPAEYSQPLGGFDAVLAFNVLHVAPDLRAGVGNVASLTAPGGLLFVLEAKSEERWDSLIDPLMTGWLDVHDDLRTGTPLLAPQQWTTLLDTNGFTASTPYDGGPADNHTLIIAERPEPVCVLDPQFDRAIATVRQITMSAPSAHRTLIIGPHEDTLDAALAAGYARGALTARHRRGYPDWTYLDTTPDHEPSRYRFGQILSAPATPVAVLANETHPEARIDPTPSPAPQPSAGSSFNQRPSLSTPYCAPRSELEERIARIWQRVFGYDRIGVDDRFLELGGESLLAMQIAAEQRNALGIETSMRQLLQSGTIAAIAATAQTPPRDAKAPAHSTPPARRGRAALRTADGTMVIEGAHA